MSSRQQPSVTRSNYPAAASATAARSGQRGPHRLRARLAAAALDRHPQGHLVKNAAKFRDALAPFVDGGTKLGRGGVTASRGPTGRGPPAARSDRETNQAIREWAKSKKIDVSDRGPIKQEIVDRYHAEAGR